jgi:hypothetical protein
MHETRLFSLAAASMFLRESTGAAEDSSIADIWRRTSLAVEKDASKSNVVTRNCNTSQTQSTAFAVSGKFVLPRWSVCSLCLNPSHAIVRSFFLRLRHRDVSITSTPQSAATNAKMITTTTTPSASTVECDQTKMVDSAALQAKAMWQKFSASASCAVR